MDLEKLLYAFFGWLAGLASPMIVEEFKRKRESRELKKALKIELMELRYRLAAAAYSIQMRFGTLNRELLNWIRPIVRDYTGLNPTHGLLTKIDKISALTDPQIEAVAQSERAPPEGALALKKYSAPLLESKFASLSSLDDKLQNHLLEIKANLSLFNDEVDQARYYFQLTFNGSTGKENYNRAVQNLTGCYKNAADRAKIIADRIGKIDW